jgi:hypothetical protein
VGKKPEVSLPVAMSKPSDLNFQAQRRRILWKVIAALRAHDDASSESDRREHLEVAVSYLKPFVEYALSKLTEKKCPFVIRLLVDCIHARLPSQRKETIAERVRSDLMEAFARYPASRLTNLQMLSLCHLPGHVLDALERVLRSGCKETTFTAIRRSHFFTLNQISILEIIRRRGGL